jgi:hypothetical protein
MEVALPGWLVASLLLFAAFVLGRCWMALSSA